MSHIIDEYIGYVWHRSKEQYIQIGASLAFSYDECKRFFEEHKVMVGMDKYSDYDFENYHIKMRRITYTNWEVIYD